MRRYESISTFTDPNFVKKCFAASPRFIGTPSFCSRESLVSNKASIFFCSYRGALNCSSRSGTCARRVRRNVSEGRHEVYLHEIRDVDMFRGVDDKTTVKRRFHKRANGAIKWQELFCKSHLPRNTNNETITIIMISFLSANTKARLANLRIFVHVIECSRF